MKKFAMLMVLIVVLMATLTSCWVDVDPGYVGVRVWKRGDKAGTIEVLRVGRHDWALRADDTVFPTFKQNYVWTKNPAEGSENDESITFPIEGLEISVDIGVEFSVIPESVGTIYSEYRMKLEGITDGPMRNYIRDAILSEVGDYSNMEQFITKNEISILIKSVEKNTKTYFEDKGIGISKVYLVGAPRYPATVVKSIEAKIEATQKAIQRENELREATAASAKAVVVANGEAQSDLIKAKSQAEANKLLEQSLSDNIIKRMWIDKWNGTLPEIMPGDSNLMISLK